MSIEQQDWNGGRLRSHTSFRHTLIHYNQCIHPLHPPSIWWNSARCVRSMASLRNTRSMEKYLAGRKPSCDGQINGWQRRGRSKDKPGGR